MNIKPTSKDTVLFAKIFGAGGLVAALFGAYNLGGIWGLQIFSLTGSESWRTGVAILMLLTMLGGAWMAVMAAIPTDDIGPLSRKERAIGISLGTMIFAIGLAILAAARFTI